MQATPKVSLWQNRDFLLLMSGQTVSMLGSGISGVAAPLLMLYLTRSPVQTGLAYTLETLPFLLFSLLAGALVDRWDRKWVMILCDIGRALNLATLCVAFFSGHLTIAQIYINSFIEGSLAVFFSSAETAAISQVVEKPQLAAGYATDQILANSASLLGPALGGLLFGLGKALPFVVDAASYVASFVSLTWMKRPFQQVRHGGRRHLGREILAGINYLWRNPLFRYMAFYGTGLLGVLSTQTFLVIYIAQYQLHASPFLIGLVLSAASIGGIAGSVLGGFIQKRLSFGKLIIGLTWLLALLWLLYLVAANLILLALITCCISMVDPMISIVYMSYRMANTPDDLRGRLNSTHRLIAFSGRPLGAALLGFLWQYAGATSTILAFGAALCVLGVSTLFNIHIRRASVSHTVQASS